MKFTGTKDYVATDDLKIAVNASIVLERPLLIKGEPGTGKTVLAEEVAKALGAPLLTWHIKSTTKAQQGLYEYDAVSRLRDSQLGDARVSDISNYIKRGKLWEAFTHEKRPVLLIDEIDKADIEFPNDLLLELDRMEFFVYETGENIKASLRPIVMITSNNEKELPDAFLRRCFFHYIKFPDADTMSRIVDVHFPGIKKRLVEEALRIFFEVREVPGLKKKPSTSELLDWLKLLLNEEMTPEMLRERDPRKLIPPLHGALLKNEQDVHLFERLAFLSRREVARFKLSSTIVLISAEPMFARTLARMQQHVLDDRIAPLPCCTTFSRLLLTIRVSSSISSRAFASIAVDPSSSLSSSTSSRRQRREIVDEIERVLDFVGDAGRELAEGRKLFGLHQAILRRAQFLQRKRKLAGACLDLVEQPRILDRDHGLVGKGPQQFDLRRADTGRFARARSRGRR